MSMHPHLREEIEAQEYAALGPAFHDRYEAQCGAAWNNNWRDEFLLTSRDVWVSNPLYRGPKCPCHPAEDPDFMNISQAEWDEFHAAYEVYFENETLWDLRLDEAEVML